MDAKEAAKALDGCEYHDEGSPGLWREMKEAGLVAVFGYSDDNAELRGAIDEEVGAWDGTTIYLTERGLLVNECRNDDCPHFIAAREKARTIEAVWSPEPALSWAYETDIPHETFMVMYDDGEPYCRGIVFRLADAALHEPAAASR